MVMGAAHAVVEPGREVQTCLRGPAPTPTWYLIVIDVGVVPHLVFQPEASRSHCLNFLGT